MLGDSSLAETRLPLALDAGAVGHAGAASVHHYVLKDKVLGRMWMPRRPG